MTSSEANRAASLCLAIFIAGSLETALTVSCFGWESSEVKTPPLSALKDKGTE